MDKVFHFESPREWYDCDAAVVWCFDSRFDQGLYKFLKRKGIMNPDPVRIAGGAKSLASPDPAGEQEYVLGQIRKSIGLHKTRRVILMLHSDCGGYGGLAAFGGDRVREAEHHQKELRRAAATVLNAIPGLTVEAYYVDFEGVWRADLAENSGV